MDPINNLNQIMQVLRQRLAQKPEQKNRVSGSKTAADNRVTASKAQKASTEEVIQGIARRINALSPDDRHGPAAVKIFVESVLIWEFGDELTQDAAFSELATEVQNSLLENQSAHEKLLSFFAKL